MASLLDRIKSALKSGNTTEARDLASQLPDSAMGEYVSLIASLQNVDLSHGPVMTRRGSTVPLSSYNPTGDFDIPVEQIQFTPEDFGE